MDRTAGVGVGRRQDANHPPRPPATPPLSLPGAARASRRAAAPAPNAAPAPPRTFFVDAVLVGHDLPELGADLVAALAGLDGDLAERERRRRESERMMRREGAGVRGIAAVGSRTPVDEVMLDRWATGAATRARERAGARRAPAT